MKTITKERILKALNNSSLYLDNKPEVHVVRTLATAGLRAVINDATGVVKADPLTDKDRLELAYQGFIDPEKILTRLSHWNANVNINSAEAIKEAWMHSWNQTLEKHWARRDKILALQCKYGVSGLDEEEIDFGNAIIKYHEPNWQLELIETDWEVLKSERIMLAEAFVSAVKFNEMVVYRRSDNVLKDAWIQAKPSQAIALANVYSWAKVWSHKSYVNYKELDRQGYTTPKSAPALDHEFEWDLHLSVGSGDPDTEHDSVWFCGRLGRGNPSL